MARSTASAGQRAGARRALPSTLRAGARGHRAARARATWPPGSAVGPPAPRATLRASGSCPRAGQ
eukprot:5244359-Lingulodinium_polyedra.AAC.1